MNKTLVFAIFDFDRFSKHDQIGEVKVPLCQIDLAQTIEEWRELISVEGEGGQVSGSIAESLSILYFFNINSTKKMKFVLSKFDFSISYNMMKKNIENLFSFKLKYSNLYLLNLYLLILSHIY